MSIPIRNLLRGMFIGAGLVAAATFLRWLMDPLLGDAQAFTIYFAAVALAAWAGGFWPALLAIVLSYFTADWFFITPRHAFNWPKFALDDFLALGGFVLSGLAIAVTSEAMRRAVARGNAKQRLLEQEVAERKKAEQLLREAQLALQHHNEQLENVVAERTATMRENLQS